MQSKRQEAGNEIVVGAYWLLRFPLMSISLARRCLTPRNRTLLHTSWLWARFQSFNSRVETDAYGIPLKPTWSVNELLSSYPTPTITPVTLKRLHELSALIPPLEGTQEHKALKWEMEDLIKLVEAVKLVDLSDVSSAGSGEGAIPDGRLWAEGTGVQHLPAQAEVPGDVTGSALLEFAARTSDGLYAVDADRRK